MATEFKVLTELFHFDKWANNLWLDYMNRKGLGDPDRAIFKHVLAAQDLWHERCLGVSPTEMPDLEITEPKLAELNARWLKLLLAHEGDDPMIEYRRMGGEPRHQRLSQIARHVIDHGTYHRGELRGLCRARGDEDFPETALMGFYWEFDLND